MVSADKDAEIVRLSVNINQETADALKVIASIRGVTVTEAVRQSVVIMHHLLKDTSKGRRIIIHDPKDDREWEITLT
jgi:hypothetical protein